MTRVALAWVVALLVLGVAQAAPITAAQAKAGMAKWVKTRPAAHMQARLGAVASVETVTSDGGANLFHVVTLEGGGFIVTSTDDRILPVIAFSDKGALKRDVRNPLWVMLNCDMPKRLAAVGASTNCVKLAMATVTTSSATTASSGSTSQSKVSTAAATEWADLLAEESGSVRPLLTASTAGVSTISDVRVPMLLSTQWDQTTDGSGKNCYNYYTPGNYYCGCVATAAAQLMRKHAYPTGSVAAKSFNCWVGTTSTNCTMMGGVYDWDAMPDAPGSGTTDAQRQAIGKLCYDAGVASRMQWTSDGSGACLIQTAASLVDVFGYASAYCYNSRKSRASIDTATLQAAIFANLDGGYPVLLGISDSSGNSGHAIVADGYGYYNSIVYTHLNLGWSGNSDAWYALPNIGTGYDFSVVNTLVFNVFPNQTGELLTGRVTDEDGDPISGAIVTVANEAGSDVRQVTTNVKGIYAAHVTAGNWNVCVAATGFDGSATRRVYVGQSASDTLTYLDIYGYNYDPVGNVGNSWGNDFSLVSASATPTAIAISGIDTLSGGASGTYVCTATLNTGGTIVVTPVWSIVSGSSYASVDADGVVTTTTVDADKSVTLHAVYTRNDVTVTADKTIGIVRDPIAEALDCKNLTFTTGGSADWFAQTTNTHDGVDALQSGKIGNSQTTWFQTTVTGPGTISFWWKAESESERRHRQEYLYDYLYFAIDGVEQCWTGGTSCDWEMCSCSLSSGSHTLTWGYCKDRMMSWGLDAGFVDQVTWTPEGEGVGSVTQVTGSTGGTAYRVTMADSGQTFDVEETWFTESGVDTSGGVTAALMNGVGANGIPRYQSYLFGLAPESMVPAEKQLKATIAFDDDGGIVVSCEPKRESSLVTYTTMGKATLDATDWVEVTDDNRANMRFFQVKVAVK